jgi:hypothetical protein
MPRMNPDDAQALLSVIEKARLTHESEESRTDTAADQNEVARCDEVARREARRYGESVGRAVGCSGRWLTYTGRSIVVRVLLENPHNKLEGHPFLRMQAAAELPYGPSIISVDHSTGVLVERRQPGVMLSDIWAELAPDSRLRSADMVAEFRTELARKAVAGEERQACAARIAEEAQKAFGPQGAWAETVIVEDIAWCHGDLHAANLLVDPIDGRLTAVLDWEWYRVMPTASDQLRLWRPGVIQTSLEWALRASAPAEYASLLAALGVELSHQPEDYRGHYSRMLELAAACAGRVARSE